MKKEKDDLYNEVFLNSKANVGFLGLVNSISLHAITIGAIYLAGHFNISPVWLLSPLIFSILRDKLKAEKELKQQIAMAAALRSDKKLILDNIEQLPSWVSFPDIDRCEWINKMLVQLWPNFSHYVMEVILHEVEPKVNNSISSFKFQTVRIGSVPPRIGGIRVYDRNVNRNEIIMDLNLFYAGDCNFSFVLYGFTGGIQNFQVCGLLRIVFKPLVTKIPLFGGLEIYFVNKPKIDYNLIGVADFLDLPGVSGMVRKIIDDQIASTMVLPNKIPIILSPDVSSCELNFPDPDGILSVNVIEAKDLVNKEFSVLGLKGISDPYVIVNIGSQSFKSKFIENSLNPKWDFWAEFIIEALHGVTIKITVMDKNEVLGDILLGSLLFDVNSIKEKGMFNSWLQLADAEKGMINLCMRYFDLTFNPDDYFSQPKEFPDVSSCLLIVFIDSAENLVNPRSKESPDSFIRINVGSKTQTSKVINSSESPVFEQSFMFLLKSPEFEKLNVNIFDQKSKVKLGHVSLSFKLLLECKHMELFKQRHALFDSAGESSVVLSLRLRVLKKT